MSRQGSPDFVGYYTYTMSWQDNATNETGFRVYNFDQFATLPANTTSYAFDSFDLASFDPDPCFAITAYNAVGESDAAVFCFPN